MSNAQKSRLSNFLKRFQVKQVTYTERKMKIMSMLDKQL